jgi:hypothetical protein
MAERALELTIPTEADKKTTTMSTTTAATPTTLTTEIPIMVTYEAVPNGPGPFLPSLPAGNGWIEGRVNVHYACAGRTATVRVYICETQKPGRPPKYGSPYRRWIKCQRPQLVAGGVAISLPIDKAEILRVWGAYQAGLTAAQMEAQAAEDARKKEEAKAAVQQALEVAEQARQRAKDEELRQRVPASPHLQ